MAFALLWLMAPQELWHSHHQGHSHTHQEHDEAPETPLEEDCALCDFHFSSFNFTPYPAVCFTTPQQETTNLTPTYGVPSLAVLAHSGLAPPLA